MIKVSIHGSKPKFMCTLKRSTLIAHQEAQVLLTQIKNHLTDNRRGEIIRSGIKLAIFGPPNSGKSSLLNFLGANTHCENLVAWF